MRINVHAGHNPDGMVGCGAIGFIKESTEARLVKDIVISQLRQMGHTVYDCTCNTGKNQSDVLSKIVSACNIHAVDLDVSIHFNSGASDSSGNGRTTGVEVLVYNASGVASKYAKDVCNAISGLGFKNRGVKVRTDLYVLRKTNAPAMLVECCFVDDRDDVQLYNCQKMAEAIVYGITGERLNISVTPYDPEADSSSAETPTSPVKKLGRVQLGAYAVPGNAEAMLKKVHDAGFKDAIIVWS